MGGGAGDDAGGAPEPYSGQPGTGLRWKELQSPVDHG